MARGAAWGTDVLAGELCERLERREGSESWPFRIMFAASIPANAEAADAKALSPSIDRVRRLMKRWSCSTALFKYVRRTISIGTGQPKRFSIRLMALIPVGCCHANSCCPARRRLTTVVVNSCRRFPCVERFHPLVVILSPTIDDTARDDRLDLLRADGLG